MHYLKGYSSMRPLLCLFLLLVRPQGLRASAPHEVDDQEIKAEIDVNQLEPAMGQLKTLVESLEPMLKGRTLNQYGQAAQGLGAQLGAPFRAATNSQGGVSQLLSDLINPTAYLPRFNSLPASQVARDITSLIINPFQFFDSAGPVDPAVQGLIDGTAPSASQVLAILSALFNLISAILYTISGGLGTIAAALGLVPAAIGLVTGPLGFYLSAEAFGLTLLGATSLRDSLYERWAGALTSLADRLGQVTDGSFAKALTAYRTELGTAGTLLSSLQTQMSQHYRTAAARNQTQT